MLRGPVWAQSRVQKSVMPTLGDLPAGLGYFKIVCRGLEKKTVGRASYIIFGFFEVACRGQKRQFSVVVR